jgi:putative ABC transport system permease protein
METLQQDIRYAFRMLRKSPGLTAVAITTLALGIGANTALFSVVDAVLLRPLPYQKPGQLVVVKDDYPGDHLTDAGISVQELDDFQNRSGVFEDISATTEINANVTGRDKPERVEAEVVSANYFTLLGAKPALGRVFAAGDYRPGFFEGTVISDGLWHRMFGADPHVLGQAIRLDSDLYTVVGVMPPTFRNPGRILQHEVDSWITAGLIAPPFPQPPKRSIRLMSGAIARINPGLTVEQAQAKLDAFAAHLREEYPTDYPAASGWTPRLVPLQKELAGDSATLLFALLASVGVVLLIACLNIASLLLARSTGRQQEIAVRQALGAGAWRLVRQMLTESVVLSVAGGVVGIVLSLWLTGLLLKLVPANLLRLADASVNPRVLLFALGISVLTGLLFGLAPAVQLASTHLIDDLRQGTRGVGMGVRQHRFLGVLVVSEFALSLVLMVGAGVLLRSFWNVLQVQPGFDPSHLVSARLWLPIPNDPTQNPYLKQEKRSEFVREVQRRVSALPGVESAAVGGGNTPFAGQLGAFNFVIEDRPAEGQGELSAGFTAGTPDFLRTLGTNLLRGRSFTDSDNETGAPVVLIDQTAADLFWPNQDPIGKRVKVVAPGARVPPPWTTIIGIVERTRSDGLDAPYRPHFLYPALQNVGFNMMVYCRTKASPEALEEAIRREVQSVDPGLPVFGVRTVDSLVVDSLASRRFAMIVLGFFACTALLLAAIGIYGVMAYFVSQRVREIGIRMALGARRTDVLKVVVSRGMSLALAGVALGILASLVMTRLIAGLLFGVAAGDPLTLTIFTIVLIVVALLANYVPARRATRVDPMVALRYE